MAEPADTATTTYLDEQIDLARLRALAERYSPEHVRGRRTEPVADRTREPR